MTAKDGDKLWHPHHDLLANGREGRI